MIVFSNTTPFIALASIGHLQLLPTLYSRIHIATSVLDECACGGPVIVPDLARFDWTTIHEDSNKSGSRSCLS